MRCFIVDTSVLVAALLTRRAASPTVRWLEVLLGGTQPVLVSTALLAEYRAVLSRKPPALDESDLEALLEAVISHARIVDPPPAATPPPDPGDAHIWALLAAEPTACLITGDQALLNACRDGRALSPKDALDRWLTSS
ncbi:MAG: PIN domain-containing protein [Nitrococcus mobilis]|nr:PIN domain-containing protein [Nitrococcus mobilis]